MKKFIIAGALALALPALSMAASFSNVQFDNGDVTISGQGGSTVNATFHIVVPANQVVERIQTDVIGDSLAPVCTQVGSDKGLEEGTYDVSLPIKLPPNTGTYTLNVQGSGIFGGIQTPDCANDVVGTGSFSSALRVVSTNVSSSTTVGGSSFADLVAAIKLALGIGATPTPTTVSAVCVAYAQANAGTMPNVYNSSNIALQGFLLSQHMSIPALAAGASFGFYGNQTTAAVGAFQAINHCQ